MSDEQEQESSLEPWISLSSWEQQSIDEIEKAPDLEREIQSEKDCVVQKLWIIFQNAATSIAQLYRDRQHSASSWVPFQNAASSVTTLYKECIESHKPLVDVSYQCGYQKRNKDLISWAKKRKRQIRREDLIAYLTGKSPPPPQRSWTGPRPRLSYDAVRTPHLTHLRFPPVDSNGQRTPGADETVLDTFKEALVGYSAANFRQHSTGSPTSSFSRTHRTRFSNQSSSSHNELNAFIAEEFSRHSDSRKRTTSTDVIMDSPTHKRSRLS